MRVDVSLEYELLIILFIVNTYEDLYEALRHNLSTNNSVDLAWSRLENIKQQTTENVKSYNRRFRQYLNELQYALQTEHSNPTKRKLALKIEEKSAINRYIMNLREQIGFQVRPLKPVSQNQAQQEALEAEIWFREKQQPRKVNIAPMTKRPSQQATQRSFAQSISFHRSQNYSMPVDKFKLSCNFCKLPGHSGDLVEIQQEEEITISETEFQPYPDDCFQYEKTCTNYKDQTNC